MGPDQRLRLFQRCQGLPCLHSGKSLEPPWDRRESPWEVPGKSLADGAVTWKFVADVWRQTSLDAMVAQPGSEEGPSSSANLSGTDCAKSSKKRQPNTARSIRRRPTPSERSSAPVMRPVLQRRVSGTPVRRPVQAGTTRARDHRDASRRRFPVSYDERRSGKARNELQPGTRLLEGEVVTFQECAEGKQRSQHVLDPAQLQHLIPRC